MDAVTSDMRRLAKAVNFGVIYGMNFFGLAQRTELSNEEASVFIKAYFETYPGVRSYLDATKEQARQRGYVETLFGRRRHLPELRSNQATVRQAAERKAINMPVQGTAADLIKLAMINTHERLHASGLRARLLLTVHDELLFEAPAGEMEDLQHLAVAAMSQTYKLNVPLKVDVRVGPTWGDLS
jgi:DNA polymerase-1